MNTGLRNGSDGVSGNRPSRPIAVGRSEASALAYQRLLVQNHPQIFERWISRLPKDSLGLQLVGYFLESREFREAPRSEQSICAAFGAYTQRIFAGKSFAPKVPPGEVLCYHVHSYDVSEGAPKGPHAKPQRVQVLDAAQVHAFVEEYHAKKHKHPVLIHPSTEDDLDDHLFGAVWLGERLPLELGALDF